jgi:hypothetical protein
MALRIARELVLNCLCVIAPKTCRHPDSFQCPEAPSCLCLPGGEAAPAACLPPYFFNGKKPWCEDAVLAALAAKKIGDKELADLVHRLLGTRQAADAPAGWIGEGSAATAPPPLRAPLPAVTLPAVAPTTTHRSMLWPQPLVVEGRCLYT